MLKTHIETVSEEREVVDEIICNCCGKEMPFDIKLKNYHDFFDLKKQWEYPSKKYGQIHKAHICEDCCDEWASTFKIPVEVKEYDI